MKKYVLYLMVSVLCMLHFAAFGQATLSPKEKKGKWGYVRANTEKFVVKAKFEDAKPFGLWLDSNRAFVKSTNQWGVIDEKGKWTRRPQYDSIYRVKRGKLLFNVAVIEKEKSFLDKQGNPLGQRFADFTEMGDKWIIISRNKKMGLLSQSDYKEILPPEYENLGTIDRENTIFYLKLGKKVNFYNAKTKTKTDFYDKYKVIRVVEANRNHPKLFLHVFKNDKQGLLNTNFQVLLPVEYSSIDDIPTMPLFEVGKENKLGVVDTAGKMILPLEFEEVHAENGYLLAKKDSLFACYTQKGEMIVPHQYTKIHYWKQENIFQVEKSGKNALIEPSGKIIVPLDYQSIQRVLQEDTRTFFTATQDKKVQIWKIEKGAASLLGKQYYENVIFVYSHFVGSMATSKGTKKMLIDLQGKPTTLTYDELLFFMPNVFLAQNKDKKGLVDTNGKILLPLEYKNIVYDFSVNKVYLEKLDKAFLWDEKTQTFENTSLKTNSVAGKPKP